MLLPIESRAPRGHAAAEVVHGLLQHAALRHQIVLNRSHSGLDDAEDAQSGDGLRPTFRNRSRR